MPQLVALIVFLAGVVPSCITASQFSAGPNSLKFALGIAVSYILALLCRFILNLVIGFIERLFNSSLTISSALRPEEAYDRCFKALKDYFFLRNLSLSCVPSQKSIAARWQCPQPNSRWLLLLTPWELPPLLEDPLRLVETVSCDIRISETERGTSAVTIHFSSACHPLSLYRNTPLVRNSLRSLLKRTLRS